MKDDNSDSSYYFGSVEVVSIDDIFSVETGVSLEVFALENFSIT